jgi:hypothetical protein
MPRAAAAAAAAADAESIDARPQPVRSAHCTPSNTAIANTATRQPLDTATALDDCEDALAD